MKKILFTLLAVLGFAVCYPALFILIGSLMGEGELQSNLSAIMNDQAGGYARWALLPEDPTWESYKALFLYDFLCCSGILSRYAPEFSRDTQYSQYPAPTALPCTNSSSKKPYLRYISSS